MPVAVWLDKRTTGWSGAPEELENIETHVVLDTVEALERTWSTDAHFTCGVIHNGDDPLRGQPRLIKSALDRVRQVLGPTTDIWFDTLVVDGDHPQKKASEDWVRAEIAKVPPELREGLGWYMTKGGYRLVWKLPVKVRAQQWEDWLQALFDILVSANMTPDKVVRDWTRCYRLPKVVRDGEPQRHPMDLSGYKNGYLRTAALESRVVNPDVGIANTRAPLDLTTVTPDGNRNDFLFRIGCKFWDRDWVPRTLLRPILDAVNLAQCVPPLEDEELDRIQRNIERYEKPEPTSVKFKHGELLRVVDESIELLATHPDIYVKDGVLVTVRGTSVIDIEEAQLRSLAAERISYTTRKKDRKTGDFYDVIIDPPTAVMKGILARGKYPGYKGLREVLATPVMLPNGTILNEPGYAADLEAAIVLGTTIERLPTAQEGIEILEELISEIAFATPADRSVALAAILTAVARTAIKGAIPMIVIESHTPGGGKTMLAEVASIIATGRNAQLMAPTGDEETEKRITAILRSGARVACIDNVDQFHPLGGAALDALTTSEIWYGRILGRSEMVECRNRALWMATGNNIRLEGDLARRVIRCYLDPKTEKPEERQFLKEKPTKRALENRSYYLAAALGVVQGYLRYGQKPKLSNFGSFENWSDIVRSALVWLGRPDPVQTRTAYVTAGKTPVWGRVLLCMYDLLGGAKPFTSSEIIKIFEGDRRGQNNRAHDGFVDAFKFLLKDADPTPHRVGAVLAQWMNRIVDGRVLRRVEDDRHLGCIYRVEIADAPPAPLTVPYEPKQPEPEEDEWVNVKASWGE